ncbi:AzlC family ABC transporter permease [Arenibacterium halophilum]|jgi:predicted branched-subunit amino acid permease|uniref:Branched-chain amino acid ABC transporter permease n=1 Tax=Arenibacterium halophilum TaxID=2583821 RepID=A0ABY2X8D9_9RHOB|nr:AzlC family ABC transporter permease [Arenibacterium halophilum]MAY86629.1 branched-chain amino acid transporter AzlC [Pseudooceanicola sp.]TMV11718.1 branched-chain amino acid ABC transporter permease [Arenibacterium halophilum]|tara:strand:- start:209 stop:925 length:717 start_codon:yes stop_codon:yes gene_type:complete
MTRTTAKSWFWRGARDSLPFIFVAGPFGLLFGVLAAEAGLDLTMIFTFSMTVFAGSAQFAALQLLREDAPTLIILASALAVNLRVAMYSASLTPYLGGAPLWQRALAAYFTVDQSYSLSIVKFETEPAMTVPQRMAYFFGTSALIAPLWYTATLVGAVMGSQIPDSWALDFALPIAFLAMIGPMLRTPAHIAAALVSIVVAILAVGIPYNLGLLVAGAAAMMTGAQVELMLKRRGLFS